jgi:hypothetical protein
LSAGFALLAAGCLALAGVVKDSRIGADADGVASLAPAELPRADLDRLPAEPSNPGRDRAPAIGASSADSRQAVVAEPPRFRSARPEETLARAISLAGDESVDSEPVHRREARQPAPKRLVLDPLRAADGGLSFRITGHDPRGPRQLVLWRLYEGNAAVVAHGRSRRDGAMEFPRLVAPHTGLVLVATPAWETANGPRASPAMSVAPRASVSPPTAGGGRRGSAGR